MVRRALAMLLLGWLALTGTAAAAPAEGRVLVTSVDGAITPVVADHLADGVRRAVEERHHAFVVELNTPGGLDTAMRKIIQAFLGAEVPVIVYVAPAGGRAASAGSLITTAAHVAAMAPGTTIGAATPIDGQTGAKASDKVVNDAAAYARSIAERRGRNGSFAEDSVRHGSAIPADDAVRRDVVDLVAADRRDLLTTVDGRQVTLSGGRTVTLRTRDAPVDRHDLGLLRGFLQLLADPTLAFLFLSIGTLSLLYELAHPGVGFAGVVGVILLILGFSALAVLPVNIAGLAFLVVAIALFAAEVYAPGVAVYAVGGAVCLALAGVFLFEGSARVNPWVLAPTALVVGGGALLAGRLAWRARRRTPVVGTEALVGQRATVRTADRVFLEGAWWTVRAPDDAEVPLRVGAEVRVVGMDGLTLLVTPLVEEAS